MTAETIADLARLEALATRRTADELVRAIAMDIGKAVVHHIETMYPAAVGAVASTFKLSVRNCTYNEIIAAIQVTDEGQIVARLRERKEHRRKISAAYKKLRAHPRMSNK